MAKKNISVLFISPEMYGLPSKMGHLSKIVERPSGGGMGDMNHLFINGLWDRGIDVHYMGPNFKGIYQKFAMATKFQTSDDYVNYVYQKNHKNIHLLNAKQFDKVNSIYENSERTNYVLQDIARTGFLRNFVRDHQKVIVVGTDQYSGSTSAYLKARHIPFVSWIHNVMTHIIHKDSYAYFNFDDQEIAKNIFWHKHEGSNFIDEHATSIKNADRLIPVSNQFEKELREGTLIGQVGLENSLGTLNEIIYQQHKLNAIPNALPKSALPENQDHLYQKFNFHSDIINAKLKNKIGFQKASNNALEINDDKILIGWTSRLDEHQKGIKGVIENIDYVMQGFPEVQIAIIGDDVTNNNEFINQLKPYIERYKGRLYHDAFSKHKSEQLYAAADIIVGNSKREPFGLFMLQGVLSGGIIASSAVGGAVDIVEHLDLENLKGNGALANDADAGGVRYALTETINAIKKSKENKEKWNKHLQNSIYNTIQKFSEEKYIDQVIDMLNGVADEYNYFKQGYTLIK